MAYPAKKQSFTALMAEVDATVIDVENGINRIKRLGANTTDKDLLNCLGGLNQAIASWEKALAEANFERFLRSEKDRPGLNFATEINALKTGAEAMRDWIDANIRANRNTTPSHTYDKDGRPTAVKSDPLKVAEYMALADLYLSNVE
jgi:hypothetical protein